MKLYKIYFSPTGGTKKILDIISGVWECESESIDLCDYEKDFSQIKISNEDICIIAVPSYGGRVPKTAVARLKEIKGQDTKVVLISVYGNRASEDTLVELKDLLNESKFISIAAVEAISQHSIMPQFASDRPDENDVLELTNFANKIKKIVEENKSNNEIKIPGNIPYRQYKGVPLKPKVNQNCNKCGMCLKKCPVQAIHKDNLNNIDKNKCISCMRCISICPQNARELNKVLYFIASKKMNRICKERKNNKIYI